MSNLEQAALMEEKTAMLLDSAHTVESGAAAGHRRPVTAGLEAAAYAEDYTACNRGVRIACEAHRRAEGDKLELENVGLHKVTVEAAGSHCILVEGVDEGCRLE